MVIDVPPLLDVGEVRMIDLAQSVNQLYCFASLLHVDGIDINDCYHKQSDRFPSLSVPDRLSVMIVDRDLSITWLKVQILNEPIVVWSTVEIFAINEALTIVA